MNDHDLSAVEAAFETLPHEIKGSYGEDFFAELAVDSKAHKFSTTLDHTPLIDQLVQSAASKSPPALLVGVSSFTESMSIMLIESMPIDLVLRSIRTAAGVLKRFGMLGN